MQQIESPSESIATQTDPELLSQFLSEKDELAFTELIRRHSGLVMRICRLFLKETSDQEDAFQATFLILAKSANRIRKQSSLSSWLHGVAYRTARRAALDMRKRQKIVRNESLEIMEAPVIDLSPFEKMQSEYEEQILHEEVQQLSQKYREPVLRRYFEGQSVPKIASELKVSVGVIEGRLKRAKSELGARLIRRGINATGFFVVATTLLSTSSASAAVSTTLTSQTATLATEALSASATTLASSTVANLASQEIAMITSAKIGTMLACLLLPAAALLTPAFLPMDSGVGVNLPISTLSAFAEEDSFEGGGDIGFSTNKKSPKKTTSSNPFGEDAANKVRVPIEIKTPENKIIEVLFDGTEINRNSKLNSGDYLNRSAARIKIEKALSESLSFDFHEATLNDVTSMLSTEAGIPIVIDGKSLEDQGYGDGDLKLYLELKNTSLQNGLDLMLQDHELDYIIKNDVLKIVSKVDAEQFHETRIYDVSKFAPRTSNLPELISETVMPDSWTVAGGEGTIFSMPGALVVRNNQRAHAAVSEVLEQLQMLTEKGGSRSVPTKSTGSIGYGTLSDFGFVDTKGKRPWIPNNKKKGFSSNSNKTTKTNINSLELGNNDSVFGSTATKKVNSTKPFYSAKEIPVPDSTRVEKKSSLLAIGTNDDIADSDNRLDFLNDNLKKALMQYEILEKKEKDKGLSELEGRRVIRYLNRIDELEEEIYQIKNKLAFEDYKRRKKSKTKKDEVEATAK